MYDAAVAAHPDWRVRMGVHVNLIQKLFSDGRQFVAPQACEHIYSEVPDKEQADPQASMQTAVVMLFNYDVRCEKCGERRLLGAELYDAHLRATGRMK